MLVVGVVVGVERVALTAPDAEVVAPAEVLVPAEEAEVALVVDDADEADAAAELLVWRG